MRISKFEIRIPRFEGIGDEVGFGVGHVGVGAVVLDLGQHLACGHGEYLDVYGGNGGLVGSPQGGVDGGDGGGINAGLELDQDLIGHVPWITQDGVQGSAAGLPAHFVVVSGLCCRLWEG